MSVITGTFGPSNPSLTAYPTLWMPMIKVSLSDSSDPGLRHIIEENVIALIDTGSDFCRIDQAMINRHPGFKQVGEGKSTGATGSEVEKIYNLQIIIENLSFQMLCFEAPLRSGGNSFDLLFGMDAIRFFDLSVVRSRQMVTLTWTGY
jgi:hypothetical protein